MKALAKMICLGTVLAWMQFASAAPTGNAPPKSPSQSSQKQPMVSNVVHDRAPVEARMEYNGNLVKKRNSIARKKARQQPPAK